MRHAPPPPACRTGQPASEPRVARIHRFPRLEDLEPGAQRRADGEEVLDVEVREGAEEERLEGGAEEGGEGGGEEGGEGDGGVEGEGCEAVAAFWSSSR